MKRVGSWLGRIFAFPVVSFIAGVLGTILLQAFFENATNFAPIEVFIYILVIILILFTVGAIANTQASINSRLNKEEFSVRVYHSSNLKEDEDAFYDTLFECMSEASESIYAVALLKPSYFEPSRARKYYFERLRRFLEAKSRQNKGFIYERIVQVETVKQGTLERSQIDALTYDHCKHLLEIKRRSTNMSARLRQMPNILSPISFFIIDRKSVVILIPTITNNGSGDIRAYKYGSGLTISSPEGSFAGEIWKIYEELREIADEIKTLG